MICAKCKADIENDSFFCDQCGAEIMMCPKCSVPKTGKVCTADGTRLVPARDLNSDATAPVHTQMPNITVGSMPLSVPSPSPAPVYTMPSQQYAQPAAPAAPAPVQSAAAATGSELWLVNNAVNIKIKPAPGDIIGRKQGAFVPVFSAYNQISGKHAQVNFDPRTGWTMTDLDSANGTQYNGMKLTPMQPQPLLNNTRIVLANIEFIVQISAGDDGDKTVRI